MIKRKTVTLYIDDTGIRLLETSGKQIKKWAELPMEPGLVKGAVIAKEAEVSSKIKQLFKAQKVKTKKVVLGFSGLHSITRPVLLPLLPRAMLAEAVVREAKRVLPIPLDQLYLSWQFIPSSSEGKIQVFLTAVPRKTADSMFKTLHEAGVEPIHMTLKPLALTRAVDAERAIIIDIQPSEFDIVIISEGVAHPMRTISLPSEAVSWREKLPLIISDIDRTINFFNTNNQEKPLDSHIPVYISGELVNMPEIQKELSDTLGRKISALPSPLEIPSQLDRSRFMTNINLAIDVPKKGVWPSISKLNLLPAPYQPRPISIGRIIVAPSTAMTVLLIAPLIMLTQTASTRTVSLSEELNSVNTMIVQRQQEQTGLKKIIADLEKDVAGAKSTEKGIVSAVNILKQRHEEVNGNLRLSLSTLTDQISLSGINQSTDTLTINGTAKTDAAVLSFATRLSSSGRFADVTIAKMQKTGTRVATGIAQAPEAGETEQETETAEPEQETQQPEITAQAIQPVSQQEVAFTLLLSRKR